MNRRKAIDSAKDRLSGSTKLMGLLAKYRIVRVFPVNCEDYVTFTVEDAPVLMAEFQNVKEGCVTPLRPRDAVEVSFATLT